MITSSDGTMVNYDASTGTTDFLTGQYVEVCCVAAGIAESHIEVKQKKPPNFSRFQNNFSNRAKYKKL